jgi:A-factor type gamma-butyrolactone 1'-reductase (1S-forming)
VCDVSSATDIQRLVAAAVERYGRLDGAFNNAGISQGGAAMADVREETFDRLLAVNLKGFGSRCAPRSGRCWPPAVPARS